MWCSVDRLTVQNQTPGCRDTVTSAHLTEWPDPLKLIQVNRFKGINVWWPDPLKLDRGELAEYPLVAFALILGFSVL